MIEHKIGFDPIDGILYTRTSGITTLKHMLEGIERVASNKSLPRKLKILEDAREAKTTFSIKELSILHEKLGHSLGDYVSVRHAVVHNDPKNFALTMLIQKLANNEKYGLQVFSSVEAAKKWL